MSVVRHRLGSLSARLFPSIYEPFRLTKTEHLLLLLFSLCLSAGTGQLFFDHPAGFWTILVIYPMVLSMVAVRKARLSRGNLLYRLSGFVDSIIVLLRSGYALENAMRAAAAELKGMYGAQGLMVTEAEAMCQKLNLHLTPEQLWSEFARDTGLKEGRELSRIFRTAKRQGGDYLPVLRAFSRSLEIRSSLREETQTLLSGQKLEYFIMCLFPSLILAYLRISAPSLIQPLYTAGGRLIMLLLFLIYAGVLLWGSRILEKAHEAY